MFSFFAVILYFLYLNAAMQISSVRIRRFCEELAIDVVGLTPVHRVTARDRYLHWLAAGYGAGMAYLSKYQAERFDPGILFPDARAIIVTGHNYFPTVRDWERRRGPFRVAAYAWGRDYHIVLR
jgi:epoxyqueuosine reductase QueG